MSKTNDASSKQESNTSLDAISLEAASVPIRNVAAIDLGSNSFHMVVAKVIGQELQLVSRHKQRVRLGSGLDSQSNLSNSAMERGLECLAMFAERLQGFELDNVRIAATHTLRQANNAHIFIQRAREILPFPIEVILAKRKLVSYILASRTPNLSQTLNW